MTQEDKELLLKDLCARLPYGVKVTYNISGNHFQTISKLCDYQTNYQVFKVEGGYNVGVYSIKPYLRPMSKMTKNEKKELSIILNYEFYVDDDFALVAEDDRHRIRLELCDGYIDWLDKNMFDRHGLIEKGLALEAPADMYKID